MNTTSERGTEVAGYLAEVRAALADLPESTRDQLIDDVPEHLAEVAAADAEPLATRLGPPARFAEDLRAAAGLAPRPVAAGPAGPTASPAETFRSLLRHADSVLAPWLGYPSMAALGRALQPGWWAVRGPAGVVLAMTFVYYRGFLIGSPARLFVVGVLALLAAAVSIRIGRMVAASSPAVRLLSGMASAFVAFLILGMFLL